MTLYDRHTPFQAKLKARSLLSRKGSTKETWHLVLDLEGSNIQYEPGDSLGVLPENSEKEVQSLLQALSCTGKEKVQTSKGQTVSFYEFLKTQANISIPTKKLFDAIAIKQASIGGGKIYECAEKNCNETIKNLLLTHTVLELLELSSSPFTPEEFTKLCSSLLPRLYSISSSQKHVGSEVHLTVAKVAYMQDGKSRFGVCTQFLCEHAQESVTPISVYVQPTREFRLPVSSQTPIIMIGPGTGVAPFRAFMQERLIKNPTTSNNWLFFGERNREFDYFYEEDWQHLVSKEHLKLNLAFSRDQSEKVYVQDLLWQERKEVWQWLQQGAIVYVCGDAKNMAKDVDQCLHKIVESEACLCEIKAKEYMKELRVQKRYVKDVY